MTPEKFEHFKQFFPKMEEVLRNAAASNDEPEIREALRQVHADFSIHSKEFFKAYAEGREYLDTGTAAVVKELEEYRGRLETLKSQLGQVRPPAAANQQPSAAPQSLDPKIGRALRDRLVAMCDPQGTAVAAIRQRHADLMHTVEDWAMGSIAAGSLLPGASTNESLANTADSIAAKATESPFDLWASGANVPTTAKQTEPAKSETPPAKKYGGVDSWINSGLGPNDPSVDDSRS